MFEKIGPNLDLSEELDLELCPAKGFRSAGLFKLVDVNCIKRARMCICIVAVLSLCYFNCMCCFNCDVYLYDL
jgi:hypothetical protein